MLILVIVVSIIILAVVLFLSLNHSKLFQFALTTSTQQLHTYWETWDSVPMDTIAYMNFNVVNMAFANVNVSVPTVAGLSPFDLPTFVTLIHSLGKKVKVALGGATYLFDLSSTTIPRYVKAVADFITANNIDGVDLDVEVDPKPTATMQIALIKALRAALPNKLISYTPKTPAMKIEPYKSTIVGAHTYLDTISFMAYDSLPGYHYTDDVTAMLKLGVSPAKIVIGLMPGPDDLNPPVGTSLADIKTACAYSVQNNLGGIMIWDLNRDAKNTTGLGINAATITACQALNICTQIMCNPSAYDTTIDSKLFLCTNLEGDSSQCQQGTRVLPISWHKSDFLDSNGQYSETVTMISGPLNSWIDGTPNQHCGAGCVGAFHDPDYYAADCAAACGSLWASFPYYVHIDVLIPEALRPLMEITFPAFMFWHDIPGAWAPGADVPAVETQSVTGYMRVRPNGRVTFMYTNTGLPFPANKAFQIATNKIVWPLAPCITPRTYKCTTTGSCIPDAQGPYDSFDHCKTNCGPNRYTCDPHTGTCSPDVAGEYDNQLQCTRNCAV